VNGKALPHSAAHRDPLAIGEHVPLDLELGAEPDHATEAPPQHGVAEPRGPRGPVTALRQRPSPKRRDATTRHLPRGETKNQYRSR